MKPTDRWPDFYDRTPEEQETWAEAIVATVVFAMLIVAVFVWLVIGTAAQ